MYKVLLVDDEIEILDDRSQMIKELGFTCVTAQNGEHAIKFVQQEQPDVILTDMKMPNQDGFYVLKSTKEIDPHIPVIFFTGYGTVESAVEAMKLGAYDYLQKPVSPEQMEAVLNRAIDHRKLKDENDTLNTQTKETYYLENVVGKSKVIMDVAERVYRVAKSDANVLIYGESGTGKELIARSLHLLSNRKDKPFIPLDCVALPASLLESEIFGFEQGSFTGAVKSKPGMIELADGGTLFLDEIVELEPNLQAKLLRVLQEHQFRRIGGMKTINVNVRIISATNWNPEKAVEAKRLRQDLYYRLNVVPIYIPPLRERKEDIPLLVHHFINKFNPSCYIEVKGIYNDALKYLKKYDWPGNVRELQNIIEQAMSLIDQEMIGVADLPENIIENNIDFVEETCKNLNFKQARERYLIQFYKQYFDNLLKKHDGNISKVAREAGISRRTIYRLIQI